MVRGALSERFAPEEFEGICLEARNRQTALAGEVIDLAQLFRLLDRLHGFGLELLGVKAVLASPKV